MHRAVSQQAILFVCPSGSLSRSGEVLMCGLLVKPCFEEHACGEGMGRVSAGLVRGAGSARVNACVVSFRRVCRRCA